MTAPGYRLHAYWRSSASWRVRVALAWKGLPYDVVPVHLVRDGGEQRSAAHRALNPMAQVPVLAWQEAGEERRLSQSLAIIEYLEAVHPTPALLPADPYLAARARQLAEIVNAGIQPLQNIAVLGKVEALGADRLEWGCEVIATGLAALQASAAATAGDYLVGDAVSIADLCLVPQLYNARRFGVKLAPLATLTAIEARCAALPAFQAAHPDRQPDALPRS